MSKLIGYKSTAGSSSSLTAELPDDYNAGDYLFVVYYRDTTLGGSLTQPIGWETQTIGGDGESATGGRYGVFYKQASSTSESDPISTSTTSSTYTAITFAVRGVNITTPIEFCATDFQSSTSAPSTTLTGTNSLILYLQSNTNADEVNVTEPEALRYLISDQSGNTQRTTAWVDTQIAAGAMSTPTALSTSQWLTIVISDDSGTNYVEPYVSNANVTPLCRWLNGESVDDVVDAGATWEDPTAAITSLDGFTVAGGDLSYMGTAINSGATWLKSRDDGSNFSSMVLSDLNIGRLNFNGSTVDLSGDAVVGLHITEITNIGSSGVYVVLEDGSGNWSAYNVIKKQIALRGDNYYLFQVQPSTATAVDSSGTVSLSAITKITIGVHKAGVTNPQPLFAQLVRIDGFIEMSGGDTSSVLNVSSMFDVLDGFPEAAHFKQGTGQLLLSRGIKLGTGSEKLIADINQESIEFINNDEGLTQIAAGRLGIEIDTDSNSSVKIRNSIINGVQQYDLNVLSGSAGTISFDGSLILNANAITLRSPATSVGTLYSGYAALTQNDATFTGGTTFDGCTGAQAITVTSKTQFEALQNCDFTNNTALAIKITGNHSATSPWSAAGMTVSGGQGSHDIQYDGTDTLVIEVDNGSGWQTDGSRTNTPNGGTLTLTAPTQALRIDPDITITVNGAIRYFDGTPDDQTPNDSGTGDFLDYEYSTTDPIDIEVVEQGYVPVNQQNVTPSNSTRDITMDFDEAYNNSHGLVLSTDYTYTRTDAVTGTLALLTDQSALDIRSALADEIRTNSSYYNTKLLLEAIPGLVRVDQLGGLTVTGMDHWKRAGSEVFDAADSSNPTQKWFAVQSVGNITGATAMIRQASSGTATAVTLTNDVVDEAFQYFSDPNHDGNTADGYDRSTYALIKSFLAGSKQGRIDVLANAGISALQSTLYVVPLSNASHDYTGVDPSITGMTLVAGPFTVGTKTFAYKLVDANNNSGEDIANWINTQAASDPTGVIPGGTGLTWFEMPDMVIYNATGVETERGYKEGATPTLVGFYVERGGSDHPDFTRFQADDGTHYTPATLASIDITNLPTDGAVRRLEIYNITGASVFYSGAAGGASSYSEQYLDGDTQGRLDINAAGDRLNINAAGDDLIVGAPTISAGDSIRIRFTELNGTTSFKSFQTIVTAASSGFSLDASLFIEADAVYATNAVDGSSAAVTSKFAPDYVDAEVDLIVAQNFTAAEAYAFFCYTLTLEDGINQFWGGLDAKDPGNYEIQHATLDLKFDNLTTTNLRQTDTARIYRTDGGYPVKNDGATTGGGGIDVNWLNQVFVTEVNTGSAVNKATVIEALTDQGYTSARAPALDTVTTIDGKVDTLGTDLGTVADEVWQSPKAIPKLISVD